MGSANNQQSFSITAPNSLDSSKMSQLSPSPMYQCTNARLLYITSNLWLICPNIPLTPSVFAAITIPMLPRQQLLSSPLYRALQQHLKPVGFHSTNFRDLFRFSMALSRALIEQSWPLMNSEQDMQVLLLGPWQTKLFLGMKVCSNRSQVSTSGSLKLLQSAGAKEPMEVARKFILGTGIALVRKSANPPIIWCCGNLAAALWAQTASAMTLLALWKVGQSMSRV